MQHRSFEQQTFKLVFCMYNKLHLHTEILSYWVFDIILSLIQPCEVQSASFEREQWWAFR